MSDGVKSPTSRSFLLFYGFHIVILRGMVLFALSGAKHAAFRRPLPHSFSREMDRAEFHL